MAGKKGIGNHTNIFEKQEQSPGPPTIKCRKKYPPSTPFDSFYIFYASEHLNPRGGGGWVAKCRNIPLEIAMCRHKTFGLDGRDFVAFEAGVSRAICIFSIVLYSLEDLNSHFLSRHFISSINKNLQNRSEVHFQTDADDDDEPRKRTPRLRRRTRSTNLFINATRRRSLPYSPSYEQSKTIK